MSHAMQSLGQCLSVVLPGPLPCSRVLSVSAVQADTPLPRNRSLKPHPFVQGSPT